MINDQFKKIAETCGCTPAQVKAVVELLDQAATIPFIARYRKEVTGSLDEVVITDIRDTLTRLRELADRKATVLKSLEKNDHLTDELRNKVNLAEDITTLEDIYLPYKPKRRTRASQARERGLEPLALEILAQKGCDPHTRAAEFTSTEKDVATVEDALAGARDIIAEIINEDTKVRADLRDIFQNKGVFKASVLEGKEEAGKKFKDYFDWQEPVKTAPSHRVLAIRRGEREEVLNLSLQPPEESALPMIEKKYITGSGEDSNQVRLAVKDSYKRLLSRSMETESRLITKERADTDAITVFAENLRQLLLSPPLGPKNVMGIDPGFRTGCKVVCLDKQGKLIGHDTIYPNLNKRGDSEASATLEKLFKAYDVEAVAIGNGTAGRETETFVKNLPGAKNLPVIMVNESGASIYSASEVARDEFPDLDLTVRGSISIGRRLMDPLSELVKIDAKSIGVGQYQHDVDQGALKHTLDDVVTSCVNGVGVDVNMASAQLLTYISGLGTTLAKNIVRYRDENGPFKTRKELNKVPRLGPKAFELSAGFLRIRDAKNPLDASAVHPESYPIVDRMAFDLNCSVQDLIKNPELRGSIDIKKYVTEKTGLPTLKDIIDELARPGRDPRDSFQAFSFKEGIDKIDDLERGMKLPGIITNVTAFGAFVDIGVHQDGLVHISELTDGFVKDPAEVVKVQQKVNITVLDVDKERKRISLSMKTAPTMPGEKKEKAAPARSKKATPAPGKQADRQKDTKTPFNNPFAALLGKK